MLSTAAILRTVASPPAITATPRSAARSAMDRKQICQAQAKWRHLRHDEVVVAGGVRLVQFRSST